jgi:hypothetical protein
VEHVVLDFLNCVFVRGAHNQAAFEKGRRAEKAFALPNLILVELLLEEKVKELKLSDRVFIDVNWEPRIAKRRIDGWHQVAQLEHRRDRL